MKLVTFAVPVLLAMSAVACAHDSAQDAKAAEAHLTSTQAQQQADQKRLASQQSNENSAVAANNGQMNGGAQSEYQARQDAKAADVNNKNAQNVTAAQQDAVEANADAKASSAKNNTGKLAANKRTIFTNDWDVYTQKKSAAKTQIDALPNTSNDAWKTSKAKLEKTLDDLEDSASNLDKMTK